MTKDIYIGDALSVLQRLKENSLHCCVTSPPYYNLRDYGVSGQVGQEDSISSYVKTLITIFREVRRVLRDDGSLWLVLGDSYFQGIKNTRGIEDSLVGNLKKKDLIGLPWRVAFALQADGWYLRQDIIWSKPNATPSSVRDRCTSSHEYIFLLTKSPTYYFNYRAIEEPAITDVGNSKIKFGGKKYGENTDPRFATLSGKVYQPTGTRRKRDVWHMNVRPYKGAHFATFPPELAKTCILAGCPPGGTVLDPFVGSGTTPMVALQTGRGYVGIELNPKYRPLIEERIKSVFPSKETQDV